MSWDAGREIIVVLVLLFLLHRIQRRNNQAIEKTLDELMVLRNERQRRCLKTGR
jgi:low affinity Fe/Cu permease